MKIAVSFFPTDYAMPIDDLAREAEARDIESLWVCEHTHIPASRKSPWPGGPDLPRDYWSTLDPFVALSAAAAVTERLRLGTAICLLTERDPIVTANQVASLDVLSKGRVEFGIGAGWNAEEMENHGTVFAERFKVMTDRAKAMKAIWTSAEATYHGTHTDFDRIWCDPRPVQQPHPPLLLGGETRHTMRRVVEWGNGWLPRARFGYDVAQGMADLREAAEAAGRDPADFPVSVFGTPRGMDNVKRFAETGVYRAQYQLPSKGRDELLPLLDEVATYVDAAL